MRFHRVIAWALPIAVAAVSACGEVRSPSPGGSEGSSSPTGLRGGWQVASIDRNPLVGVALVGDDDALAWLPVCAGWSTTYRRHGTAIRFAAGQRTSGDPRASCKIGHPAALPRIFHVLPLLDRIDERDGTIRLSGGGHEIILERPLPDDARAVRSLGGQWMATTLDGTPLELELQFSATRDLLSWLPDCAGQARTYAIENNRISIRPHVRTAPDGANPPICTVPVHPTLMSVFAAMEAATHVRPLPGGGVRLEGNGRSVTLMPRE